MTDLPSRPSVDVVVVSWQHDRWLSRCLPSVAPGATDPYQLGTLVVVDNAATVDTALPRVGGTPVTVVSNRTNEGFARACNQGAVRGTGDWILFLNPDTEVTAGAIARALDAAAQPGGDAIGLVGLRLVDGAGTTQRTCGRFPTLGSIAAQALGLSRAWPQRWPGIRLSAWAHDESRAVDFACAAALLVRRTAFEAIGGFDERLFLYMEDADLSLRMRTAGWQTHFRHDAVVEHECGWSTGVDRPWRLAHSWRSLVVYAHLHLGRLQAWMVFLLIFALAPLARGAEAVADRRWSPVRDAWVAWSVWLRLLGEARGSLHAGGDVAFIERGAEWPREA